MVSSCLGVRFIVGADAGPPSSSHRSMPAEVLWSVMVLCGLLLRHGSRERGRKWVRLGGRRVLGRPPGAAVPAAIFLAGHRCAAVATQARLVAGARSSLLPSRPGGRACPRLGAPPAAHGPG